MVARRRLARNSDAKRLSHVSIFGPPPVLECEDPAAYDDLLLHVTTSVRPSDILEEIWVRDIVDLTWEILRWRRLKMCLIADEIPYRLREILAPIVDADEDSEWMDELMAQWQAQKPSAITDVQEHLASGGKTIDNAIARAFLEQLDEIERIEHIITIAEGRRNSALREIDRHRTTFAQGLRSKIQEFDGTNFKAITNKPTVTGDASSKAA